MLRFTSIIYIILTTIIITILSGCSGNHSNKNHVNQREGNVHLLYREGQGPANAILNGDWEFYPGQLLTPVDFQNAREGELEKLLLPPNRPWNKILWKGKKLPGQGFGTYRLRVHLHPSKSGLDTPGLGLRIPGASTSYRVWIDNRHFLEHGKVGRTPATSRPYSRPRTVFFKPLQDQFDIIIQVANFSRFNGRLRGEIEIARAREIEYNSNIHLSYDLFLFGSLIIIGIYHLGLFILRRKERSLLYLGLFCLFIGARAIISGEILLLQIFPNLNWSFFIHISVLSAYLAAPLYMLFTQALFPEELPEKFLRVFFIIWLIFLASLALPVDLVIKMLFPWTLVLLGGFSYILAVSYLAFLRKRSGSTIFLTGNLLFFMTLLADAYNYFNQLGSTLLWHPLGLFLFILAHSLVLSRRYSQGLADSEDLSARLLSLDKLKDEFLANTSHELRTPIHGMIGLAEALVDGAAGELQGRARAILLTIISSGKRLSHLVNDILDFSRMQNRDVELDLQLVDLAGIADLVIRLCEPLLGEKPVRLYRNIPDNLLPVLADENRLQQILYNLLGNAVKFTHEGSVCLRARAINNNRVQIQIIDTGIGISPSRQEAIFNSFEQGDGSIQREYGGTGLGLSITRKLLEMHESVLELESKPGAGSVFSFSLPSAAIEENIAQHIYADSKLSLADSLLSGQQEDTNNTKNNILPRIETPPPTPEIKTSPPPGFKYLKTPTILIVDDEPVNLDILESQIQTQNYRVLRAQDGPGALALIQKEKVDLAVLDLMMPRMSGYELCRRIRKNHDLISLPIIMLTAKNSLEDLVGALDMGANDYLTKPFQKAELIARIRTNLNIKENNLLYEEVARRKQAEEDLVEMNINKDRFFSIISHDLLGPFSGFISLLEQINRNREELDHDAVFEQLERLYRSGNNIFRLMNTLLDWARLQLGRMDPELGVLNIQEIIEKNLELFFLVAEQKEISVQYHSETEILVLADSLMTDTILRNLLSNALKFSSRGDQVSISARQNAKFVEIVVEDTGAGMDEERVLNLFRLDEMNSTPGTLGEEGTGLGLILCRDLVQKMNGEILVKSQPGQGSRFAFTLPSANIPHQSPPLKS